MDKNMELKDQVIELACNIDDMTGEEIGFAAEELRNAGAKDVFMVPIQTKKSRPGIILCVICDEDTKEEMARLIFKHTTTIGIREAAMNRYILDREEDVVETPYGEVHRKKVAGYGTERYKYEYEDLATIARDNDITIKEVRESANKAEDD